MKRFVLLLIVLFSADFSVAHAGQRRGFDPSRLSESGRRAYRLLLDSEMFALGHAGSLTEREPALLNLMGEEAAVDALVGLVEDGSPEGGLYGLLGLRQLDAESFREAVRKYRSKEEPPFRLVSGDKVRGGIVSTNIQSGCISSWEDRLDVVSAIEAGKYDAMLKGEVQ